MTNSVISFSLRQGEVYIELYKLLKAEGLVEAGSHAKYEIEQGNVLVNGVVETRKRKKIIEGDKVCFSDTSIQVVAC